MLDHRFVWAVVLGLAATTSVFSADHRDAPNLLVENGGDRSLDVNDIYVFKSPGRKNSTLIMTVNPFIVPGDETPTFNVGGKYEFLVDTNRDAVEDVVFTIQFQPPRQGAQSYIVRHKPVGGLPQVLALGRTGRTSLISGGGLIQCGIFDDPFFFDLQAFRDTVGGVPMGRRFNDGMEVDFFANANVSAIVLDIPSELLGGSTVRIWGRTLDNAGLQVDRTAIPVVNTVFIPGSLKQDFNEGIPSNDLNDFLAPAVQTLLTTFGRTLEDSIDIGLIVLPDVLTFNSDLRDGFLNGRRLEDDVLDPLLGIVTDLAITTDSIDSNDAQFRPFFPYLAPAQLAAP